MIMFLIGARWSEPDDGRRSRRWPACRPAWAMAQRQAPRGRGTVLAAVLVVLLPQLASWGAAARRRGCRGAAARCCPTAWATGVPTAPQIAAWRPRFGQPIGRSAAGLHRRRADRRRPHRLLPRPGPRTASWSARRTCSWTSQDRALEPGRQPAAHALRTADAGARPCAPPNCWARRRRAPHVGPQLMVWRTYWVDGSFVAGDAAAKLRGALARLRGRGDDGAWVVLYADAEIERGVERRARARSCRPTSARWKRCCDRHAMRADLTRP